MTDRLKRNLKTWGLYSLFYMIILWTFQLFPLMKSIGIGIILGSYMGILNDILTYMRKTIGDLDK